jgi:AraC-like DNA-binding protein
MGQHTVRTNRHVSKDFLVLIVHLQPGVFHRITGIPFDSLTNTDLDAELVFPKQIKVVNENLSSTDSYQEMIDIVETFLIFMTRKFRMPSDSIDEIGKLILDKPGKFTIEWLARQACLSPRQLERKFKARMGVGPKTFSRIARLHQTYQMKHKFPDEDWLSIAVACGYHDYQHLSKDYMDLAQATPVILFNEDETSPEKVLGMKETF